MARMAIYPFGRVGGLTNAYRFPRSAVATAVSDSRLFEAAASGVIGSLAATETGADTAAFAGKVIVRGTIAATESGVDIAAFAGDVLVQGALAASETGSDAAAIVGKVIVQGALAASESGVDVAQFTGSVSTSGITGTLAAVEAGDDVAAFAGTVSQPQQALHGRAVRKRPRGKVVTFEDELPPAPVAELPKPAIRASIAGDVALVARIDAARVELERVAALDAAEQAANEIYRQTLAALQAEYTAALDALELARQREAAIIARLRDEDDFMLLLAA